MRKYILVYNNNVLLILVKKMINLKVEYLYTKINGHIF